MLSKEDKIEQIRDLLCQVANYYIDEINSTDKIIKINDVYRELVGNDKNLNLEKWLDTQKKNK